MTKKAFDYAFVAAMVALSCYVGITALRYPQADIEEGYGPGIYPLILAIAIFLLAMLQLVFTILKNDNEKIKDFSLASLKNPAAFWGLLLLYCVSLKTLGILLSSFLFLLISSKFLFRVKWVSALATAVVAPLVVWAVFEVGMKVPLPFGTIWNLFR
jgi:putative tricarboxylic transport membrane protein